MNRTKMRATNIKRRFPIFSVLTSIPRLLKKRFIKGDGYLVLTEKNMFKTLLAICSGAYSCDDGYCFLTEKGAEHFVFLINERPTPINWAIPSTVSEEDLADIPF